MGSTGAASNWLTGAPTTQAHNSLRYVRALPKSQQARRIILHILTGNPPPAIVQPCSARISSLSLSRSQSRFTKPDKPKSKSSPATLILFAHLQKLTCLAPPPPPAVALQISFTYLSSTQALLSIPKVPPTIVHQSASRRSFGIERSVVLLLDRSQLHRTGRPLEEARISTLSETRIGKDFRRICSRRF